MVGRKRRTDNHTVGLNISEAFGQIVREHRLKRGLTQRDLAATTNLEQSTIAYIESGTRLPSLLTCVQIAAALDLLPSQLLRELERRLDITTLIS